MFGDVLDRKESFLDNKNMYFYVRKIGNFPKGLTHDVGEKFELSSFFVFIENRPRNDVWDVLDRKEAFLDNNKMYLISPKNRKFSKGVNRLFWSKTRTFFIVCFY